MQWLQVSRQVDTTVPTKFPMYCRVGDLDAGPGLVLDIAELFVLLQAIHYRTLSCTDLHRETQQYCRLQARTGRVMMIDQNN